MEYDLLAPQRDENDDPDHRLAEFEGAVEVGGVRLSPLVVQELRLLREQFGCGSLAAIPPYLLRKAANNGVSGKVGVDGHGLNLEDTLEYNALEKAEDEYQEKGDESELSLEEKQECALERAARQAWNAAYHLGGTRPIITGMHVFGTFPVRPATAGFGERNPAAKLARHVANEPEHALYGSG